jgi:uncharacterized protein YcbK (DUF882 family)
MAHNRTGVQGARKNYHWKIMGRGKVSQTDWTRVRYFKPNEFDDPTMPGTGTEMQREIIGPLDYIREHLGKPMVVNSGYRTTAHNIAVGGATNSAHMRGLAADIKAVNSATRWKIVYYAMEIGITRIGIGPTIVHLDADLSLPQDVLWLY